MMNFNRFVFLASFLLAVCGLSCAGEIPLYESEFKNARYGRIPDGWRDLIDERPSRNWAVDGNGLLRSMLKLRTGLLVYDGYTADVKPARALGDARLVAEFKKTEDEGVTFGVAGRVV